MRESEFYGSSGSGTQIARSQLIVNKIYLPFFGCVVMADMLLQSRYRSSRIDHCTCMTLTLRT